VEDYTSKYKGEQVEVALMNGDYQDGVLTSYCARRRRTERPHPHPAAKRGVPPLLEPL